MKSSSRAVADCSADPLRVLFVESTLGNTEFTLDRCEKACTIKRLYSLAQAAPFLRTSLFQVLIVNDSAENRFDWNELQKLQEEFPAVEIVVLTDAEPSKE
jgi:hypothetical protein